MSKLSSLPAKEIMRALQKAEFRIARQKGSHVRLVHVRDSNRYATVAVHSGDVPRKNVASILRQARISVEEFLALLRE